MGRTIGTKLLLFLAVISILWTALCIAVGLNYYLGGGTSATVQTDFDPVRTFLVICTPINLTLTFLFVGVWYIRAKHEQTMEDLAGYLKMYRRIPLGKVAQRLGMTEMKAEKLLLECSTKGLVKGFLDRQTDEFILEESISTMRGGSRCPSCGAYSDKVVLPGEVMTCSYCGAVVPPAKESPDAKGARCNVCGGGLRFISTYQRWYCDKCGKYQ